MHKAINCLEILAFSLSIKENSANYKGFIGIYKTINIKNRYLKTISLIYAIK